MYKVQLSLLRKIETHLKLEVLRLKTRQSLNQTYFIKKKLEKTTMLLKEVQEFTKP